MFKFFLVLCLVAAIISCSSAAIFPRCSYYFNITTGNEGTVGRPTIILFEAGGSVIYRGRVPLRANLSAGATTFYGDGRALYCPTFDTNYDPCAVAFDLPEGFKWNISRIFVAVANSAVIGGRAGYFNTTVNYLLDSCSVSRVTPQFGTCVRNG